MARTRQYRETASTRATNTRKLSTPGLPPRTPRLWARRPCFSTTLRPARTRQVFPVHPVSSGDSRSQVCAEGRGKRSWLDWAAEACPRDVPELPSTANDRRQQQPANMKPARALKPRATHENALVMRRSGVRFPKAAPIRKPSS